MKRADIKVGEEYAVTRSGRATHSRRTENAAFPVESVKCEVLEVGVERRDGYGIVSMTGIRVRVVEDSNYYRHGPLAKAGAVRVVPSGAVLELWADKQARIDHNAEQDRLAREQQQRVARRACDLTERLNRLGITGDDYIGNTRSGTFTFTNDEMERFLDRVAPEVDTR